MKLYFHAFKHDDFNLYISPKSLFFNDYETLNYHLVS